MKKVSLKAACVLLAGSFLCSSCIGSFSLFNGYEKWQCNMTSNKYVNGIVGLILQPIVGGICLTVDAVVLNTINANNDSWSMTQNGVTKEIIRFNADGTIQATLQNGEKLNVSNDEAGVMQVREAVYNENCYAMR